MRDVRGGNGIGRNFSLLWSASSISMLGDGMRVAALPLLAATMAGSAAVVSAVTVAGHLPWLLFSLFGGVIVDHFDRVRLLWLAGLAQAVLVGAFAVWMFLGTPDLISLVLLALLMGCVGIVHLTASNALLPDVVGSADLERANARLQGSSVVALQLLGPLLGTAVFALSHSAPFAIDAASFLCAALLVRLLAERMPPTSAKTGLTGKKFVSDVGEGIRWLWSHPGLRLLALELGLAALALQLGTTVMVLLVTKTLGAPATVYGLVLATGAAGGLIASAVAGRLRPLLGVTGIIVLSITTMGASLLIAGAGSSVVLVAAMYGLGSFGVVLWSIQSASLRQRLIPRELRGRVGSVYRLIGWGGVPIGAALSGVLATAFGVRVPFFVGGTLLLLSLALVPRFSNLRAEDIPATAPNTTNPEH
ncbi:MFS transporter [Actinosynnema sp. NPDC051121]